jgi:predicted aldo/keto reductase-like oxidoreductase
MQFKQLKSLRTFIFLLLAVFFTDTIYASGMMVADQLSANHHTTDNAHSPEPTHVDAHDHHKDDTQQEESSSDHCSKCGHCMACFTVLPPSQLDNMQSEVHAVANSLFESSYISHVSAQPNRPPIS